jgi:hypothetical protein
LPIGIVEIARDDSRAEPEAARCVRKEHRKIPTRSPAAIQSLGWRLGALVIPALIAIFDFNGAGLVAFARGCPSFRPTLSAVEDGVSFQIAHRSILYRLQGH